MILVPVTEPAASHHLIRQAAWLARQLRAELVLLHVLTPLNYPAGLLERGDEITARDWRRHVVQVAGQDLEEVHEPELDGLAVTRLLLRGEPGAEIVRAARDRDAGLIVMSTRGEGPIAHALLGSVTGKVLRESTCPVWTGVHLEDEPARDPAIRRILCSVELTAHSSHTLARAAEWASALGASLTLVHITPGVEKWGPGGNVVDEDWKRDLVAIAARQIAALQQEAGTNAEVIIESGNVAEGINRAADRSRADVLILGHLHGLSHLGDNDEGYGIIRQSRIPVLSV